MALSARDRDILVRTILGEAAGEDPTGQAAVAHVIRNRMGDPRWPGTASDVALQKKQFSAWNAGPGGNHLVRKYGPGAEPYEKTARIVDSVFGGDIADPTKGATHYYSPAGMQKLVSDGSQSNVLPRWLQAEADRAGGTTPIGNHIFTGKASGVEPGRVPQAVGDEAFKQMQARPPAASQPAPGSPSTLLAFAPQGPASQAPFPKTEPFRGNLQSAMPVPDLRPDAPVSGPAAQAPAVASREGPMQPKTVSTTLPASPQEIARRRAFAEAMQREASDGEVIRDPLQGVNQMAQAAVGGLGMMQANKQERARQEALAGALGDLDPSGPISQEQIARLSAVSPEMGMQLYGAAAQQASSERQRLAAQEKAANTPKLTEIYVDGRQQKAYVYPDGRTELIGGTKSDTLSPEAEDQKARIAAAGKSSINIGAGEKEFDKKLAGKQAEMFSGMFEAGQQAKGNLANIQQLRGLLQNNPGGLVSGAQQIASGFGIKLGENVSDLEAANAIISKMIPQQRPPGSGTMSDADLNMFKDSLPRLMNTPQGNAIIMDTMESMASFQLEEAKIAGQVMNGVMTREQATEALQALPDPMEAFKAANPAESSKPPGGVIDYQDFFKD